MINLSGLGLLEGSDWNFMKVSDSEVRKLSTRCGFSVFAYITSYKPIGILFNNVTYLEDFVFNLGINNKIIYLPLANGLHLSLTKRPLPNSVSAPKYLIDKYILPYIDDDSKVDRAIRSAEWAAKIIEHTKLKDSVTVFSSSLVFHNIEGSRVRDSFLKKGILLNWEEESKLLIIDFIYDRGKIDAGELMVDLVQTIVQNEVDGHHQKTSSVKGN